MQRIPELARACGRLLFVLIMFDSLRWPDLQLRQGQNKTASPLS
jgi:hypothetical protein